MTITTLPDGSLEVSSKENVRIHLTCLVTDEPDDDEGVFDPENILINITNQAGEMITLNVLELKEFEIAFNKLAKEARRKRTQANQLFQFQLMQNK